ncbi:endonuclease/exonuclease/phosphatase family protein [Vibrio sp. TH_r3]|uniref:endonuclease/exonuclease/phosphatase family protein n=1 Tax=Vibrio sp. TH_r3 TaxID=3082084 RepID=UPI002952B9D9|nr:endonuclease/exonuclease/phosphatase family protein [Vibrio sp. TH_r3]MDV7105566.1 endonuclease/exonuclease/phosphatase family protein [Vibrio sp. TH_r3]
MKIISWNVQNGVDAYAKNQLEKQYCYLRQQEADVIALQEVDGEYFIGLKQMLKEYDWHLADAITYYEDDQLKRFGNVIGAKKGTILQWRAHCLLPTATNSPQHMTRSVGEIVVKIDDNIIRVLTCHLEFYCQKQRRYQIEQIDQIVQAATVLNDCPSGATEGLYKPLPLPVDVIICGDLNLTDDSVEYRDLIDTNTRWFDLAPLDAKPTCGLFDTQQWQNGADRRDYFFTNNSGLKGEVWTDIKTSLSDHQPIFFQTSNL